MLEANHAGTLIDGVWSKLECHIALPNAEQFLSLHGAAPLHEDDRRAFRRFLFRRRAVMRAGDCYWPVFAMDCSRSGMGWLHDRQMFPGTEIVMWTSHFQRRVQVRRCRRLEDHCFIIGGVFLPDAKGVEQLDAATIRDMMAM